MGKYLKKLMGAPGVKPLLSNEHFQWTAPCCMPGLLTRR